MFDVILFPGLPGGPEILIVAFILVLLFGANKIPALARSLGKSFGEVRRGRKEIERELEGVKSQVDADAEAIEDSVADVTQQVEDDAEQVRQLNENKS